MGLSGHRGHREILAQLGAELRHRPSHAYLFSGPRGVGKNLVAESLVHGLFCERGGGEDFCCAPDRCPMRSAAPAARRAPAGPAPRCNCCAGCTQVALRVHPDFSYVSRPPNRTDVLIEQVRDLIGRLGGRPVRAPMRLAIIDDAETLSLPAQNALLKTLEEPPGNAIIFLIAQSDRALLDTVRSRLRPVRFGPLGCADIAAILQSKAGLAAERAGALALLARGSAARALAMAEGDQPPVKELMEALRAARGIDFARAQGLAQEFFAAREQAGENFELLAHLLAEILAFKLLGTRFETPSAEAHAAMAAIGDTFSIDAILIAMDKAVAAGAAVEARANPRLQAEQWWLAVGAALRGE